MYWNSREDDRPPSEKYFLGDGYHYFVIKPDKYSGAPLAKLWSTKEKSDSPIAMLTVGDKSTHDLMERFEYFVMMKEKEQKGG